jgi:membrane protein DedA with SNARE-associated domain
MSAEVSNYIAQYGYFAIFGLIFIQEIGIPNPIQNELVLLFSRYLTFTRVLSLPLVLFTALTADTTGAVLLYFLFFYFGSFILSHKPAWLPISESKINNLSKKISASGLPAIFIGRITPFIRGYVSVISGLIHIGPKRYLPLVLVTAIIVCCSYILAGRLLGPHWSIVMSPIIKMRYYLACGGILVLLFVVVRRFRIGGKQ